METPNNKTGNVAMTQLITWGIGLATFTASITYASYAKTQNDVIDLRIKQATTEQRLINIETNTNLLVQKLIKNK